MAFLHKSEAATQEMVDEIADTALQPFVDGAMVENTGIAEAIAAGSTVVSCYLASTDSLKSLFAPASSVSSIFVEGQDYIIGALRHSTDLTVPEGQLHLSSLQLVAFTATTVDNKWFCIKANTRITIRAIIVNTDVSMGMAGSYYHYGELAEAIATTFACNADRARPFLKSFYLEPTAA